MQVSEILEEKGSRVVSIGQEASIAEAATLLRDERIGVAVVRGEEEDLLGIVSERDIVRAIADLGDGALRTTAGEVMSRSVVTCSPESSTADVMEQMLENQIRHLPVQGRGSLVGIISVTDVVKAVHAELKQTAAILQNQVVASAGWATDED